MITRTTDGTSGTVEHHATEASGAGASGGLEGKAFHFADRLAQRIVDLDTRVCVGLDPDLAYFPRSCLEKYRLVGEAASRPDEAYFQRVARCIVEFNKRVIDIVADHCAAVKPQSACYERFGCHGTMALHETAGYARAKGLLVILDAKRNDIGSTAGKYASAYLGPDEGEEAAAIPVDALTINPYLGTDSIKPFVDFCARYGKGLFILVKTSNPSSGDIQNLLLQDGSSTVAQRVASLVDQWGSGVVGAKGYSAVGAVVGATHPDDVRILRDRMPKCFFLMPGYGAQGAKAEDVKDAFLGDGLGALVNSSRGITYPCRPNDPDFFQKIEQQVRRMQADLNRVARR